MKRTYDMGIDPNQIRLDVKVGTVGVAYTVVKLLRSGGQSSKIAESDQGSGNITEKNIGTAQQLRAAYLLIRTWVDLPTTDKSQWDDLAHKIVVRYHISGGFSGNQTFNYDTDDADISPDGKMIVISKPIQLL